MKKKIIGLLIALMSVFTLAGLGACNWGDTSVSTSVETSVESSAENSSSGLLSSNSSVDTSSSSVHKHSFKTLKYNAVNHWYECSCGAKSLEREHNYKNGVCNVCGDTATPTAGIVYDLSADGTYAEVIDYTGKATDVVIADTYQGVPVTSIYNAAFFEKEIKSVVIPNSVTLIGGWAFSNCYSLTGIEIPDSVTEIGEEAFSYCLSLTSIEIPDSVTEIGSWAFFSCFNLTSIEIPDSVTSIERRAFSDCTRLTNIKIPDSVTEIGGYVFHDCESLTSVVIPDSVTEIGEYIFCDCTSLTNITFTGTVSQWEEISKGEDWNYNVPATKVVCSDGEISL